jgi:hypothetical protein
VRFVQYLKQVAFYGFAILREAKKVVSVFVRFFDAPVSPGW